ncbi:uncharacterized protein LOC119992327 isoform X1 [Tripterygium wilfordii]|uniref:uncharacterized protein LOC119992327 isoform X1 n=1 Tax=Tripterygium wilfordii TaxID=458696 RepID=UPI0018F850D2|nr:uncharacterized protein LOC119992327 isoform X1 [Tripterygium wilfordii]
MENGDNRKFAFPLTSLQIGDLQSYHSDLRLFLAPESYKLYILVDNRPWLSELGSRPSHLWQLMVTKSRLSPFANTKGRREKKEEKKTCSPSNATKSKKFGRWFSLINAATLSQKRVLLPVKKLRNSSFLSIDLHRTLYGFIVFEVTWSNVRGINYLNELQCDTSLAIETKFMQRWEFDSISQAASCISSWFSGTCSEQLQLKEYLNSAIGEVFHDAEEDFPRTIHIGGDDDETISSNSLWVGNDSAHCIGSCFSTYPATLEDEECLPHTPPPTGPYKRRRVTRSTSCGVEVDFYSEEMEGPFDRSDTCSSDYEHIVEPTRYRDVLILFRFDDRDLPFMLKKIIMSDLRLLTLLEAGLPSWVIFLQSYPGFCHLYRPWMCPLARALYVLISIVTVLIGFYDLYKNVPVLKATASRLFGPLFDWIETWEMVSRIKYLGTMLFLHNFEKAVTWILTLTRTSRSFFSVLTQPLSGPLMEFLGFLLPLWNVFVETTSSLSSMVWILIGSSCSLVGDLVEVIMWPICFAFSVGWNIATSILYPIFYILWEMLYAPIRIILAAASLVSFLIGSIAELVGDILLSAGSIFQFASNSGATVSKVKVSMWRSLWNDLFSQVFRATRSILNGFVAFFAACNRHRLSIYNHLQEFVRRLVGRMQISHPSDSRHSGPAHGTQTMFEVRRKVHIS